MIKTTKCRFAMDLSCASTSLYYTACAYVHNVMQLCGGRGCDVGGWLCQII